jgi:translocation and assembly module TamB
MRRRLLEGVGLAVTFAGGLAVGAAIHAGSAPTRRLTAELLSRLLTQTFQGRVTIERIERIDLGGFDGAYATVDDPKGARVLAIEGMRARAPWVPLVISVLRGESNLELVITHARIEHVTADIEPDTEEIPTLARAFTPRPGPGGGAAPTVKIWLPDVQLGTACVRGRILGLPSLDVDIANVAGSVLAGTARTEVRVKRYSLTAHGITSAALQGTAQTLVALPSATGHEVGVWGTLDGYLGDVPVTVRAGLDGKELMLVGDVPRATSEALRAILPGLPIFDTASLHLEAKGTIPEVAVTGLTTLGGGSAQWSGKARLGSAAGFDLDVDARDVDLRAIVPSLPPAVVSAAGKVKLVERPDDIAGEYAMVTQPFLMAGVMVPRATIAGGFTKETTSGKAVFDDRLVHAQVDYKVHPDPSSQMVAEIDATVRAPEMSHVPWLAPVGHGAAEVRARGEIAAGKVDARFDGSVSGYSRGIVSLERASVSGSVRGAPLDPALDATLRGKNLVLGPLAFPEVDLRATGKIHDVDLGASVGGDGLPTITARGNLALADAGPSLRGIELRAARGETVLSAKVASIRATDAELAIEGIAIEGAGAPVTGSLRIGAEVAKVHVAASDIDVGRMAQLLAPELPLGGRLSLDADLDVTARGESGHLRARVQDGKLPHIDGISGEIEAKIAERAFSGGVHVVLAKLGSLTVTAADARLDGSLLRIASWRHARGSLQYNGNVDLAELGKLRPSWRLKSADVAGMLYSRGMISRDDAGGPDTRHGDSPPTVDALVWTEGLDVRAARRDEKAAPPAWQSKDLDVQVGAHLDGPAHAMQLNGRLVDKEGIFAALTITGDLSTARLFADPAATLAELPNLPLNAHLALPRRSLATYPGPLRPAALAGDVEASFVMSGSVLAPRVTTSVHGYAMQSVSSALAIPVDATVEGAYDGAQAVLRLQARRPEGIVLDATTSVHAPIAALTEGHHGPAWEASGSARVVRFPLASFPILADKQIAGTASGTLTFSGLNRDPSLEGRVDLSDVKVDKADFPRGTALLRIADGGAVLSAKLDQADGGASVTASGRVDWTSGVLPVLDRGAPTDVFLAAKKLRAAALYPLLFEGIFTYFDGTVDGTLHLRQDPTAKETEVVDGSFELRDGVFQVPEVGQEFKKAKANIFIAREGTVYVTDLSASGLTGAMTGSATLKLRGFTFESGEGSVYVSQKQPIPLTIEGVSLGEAWGQLALRAEMADKRTVRLDVDVPSLHTELPESSTRDVQALGDNPDVHVGMRSRTGELTPLLIGPPEESRSEEALKWHVEFHLGQDVTLRRGPMLEVGLRGKPIVDLTDKAHVTGEVSFSAGHVEVMGKRFEIEKGTATFDGEDPSNPDLDITAWWDEPREGTRIYLDYLGPLKTGKTNFRSRPTRSQKEIMAILLFGSADEMMQAKGGANASAEYAAAGIAGGQVLTRGVNQVISSVSPVDITTRVDTSQAQNPTPEVAVQLSRKVTAEVSYRTRSLPGEKPDRVLLTLDWRFLRNWSIATTVGDAGSSVLDLIWQYRY